MNRASGRGGLAHPLSILVVFVSSAAQEGLGEHDFIQMTTCLRLSQLPSCSGLGSSVPSQSKASFLMAAQLLLRNVPSALALKFLLTDSFLAVIQFCHGFTLFGNVEVSLNPEMDFKEPSELRKISK
ncbi:hypothetical protein ACJJTC_004408 [Scirpophaga incertulas]